MPTARLAASLRLAATLLPLVFTLGIVGAAQAVTGIQDACGSAPAGHVRCEAQIVVSRKATLMHPKLRPVTMGTHSHAVAHSATINGAVEPQPATPLYLQQAYDLTALSATGGVNTTIAVVDAYNDPSVTTDLATFRADSGLPACNAASGCFRVLNELGTTAPLPVSDVGWSVEESLDVDAVSALCPNCRIVLVEANGSDNTDMQYAIQAAVGAGATIVSNSWSALATTSPFTSSLSYPGVSILAASGDDGTAPSGLSTYPAALPNVTAVGGTTLNPSPSTARGYSETAWDGTGSGCDTYESSPAWQPQTGCVGRAYNDISADGDPNTGLDVYDSQDGGWLEVGGSSLAAPLAAAFEAVTGVNGTTAQWVYTDESLLNGVYSGSNGSCALSLICNAATGWNGPDGAGSISGDIVAGAPGIGGPDLDAGTTYTENVTSSSAVLQGGIYPNGEATSYYWQYGKTAAYGSQTTAVVVPAGTAVASVGGTLASLAPSSSYHYRLVATNASGTSYGYDFTLDTTGATPNSTVVKSIVKPVQHKPAKKHKPARQNRTKRTSAKHKPLKKHRLAKTHKAATQHKRIKRDRR
jgi:subtilase family serine protease